MNNRGNSLTAGCLARAAEAARQALRSNGKRKPELSVALAAALETL